MPRNQHKKYNSSESDHDSDASRNYEQFSRDKCNENQRACIICPPCDYRERYDSSNSDPDCPNFSDLCEDKPKICCKVKDLCKKDLSQDCSSSDKSDKSDKFCKSDDSSECSESSKSCESKLSEESCDSSDKTCESKSSSESCDDKSDSCNGCDRRCTDCAQCVACACRECSDYSKSSVLNALSVSDASGPSHRIAADKKKKCYELPNLCGKKESDRKESSVERKEFSLERKELSVERKELSAERKELSVERKELLSDKKESGSDKKESGSARGKKFVVSFKSKVGHPWEEYNPGDKSVHINGKNGPVLHLYRNCTYFFCVEQDLIDKEDPKHAFVLTNSPAGGPDSKIIPSGFSPVSRGCVCFKVDKCTPRYFYYQDIRNTFAGGLVIVHDQLDNIKQ